MRATKATPLRAAVAHNVGRVRVEKGFSARALAAECEAQGVPGIDRQRIANLESQRGRPLEVGELFGLSYVLKAWPTDLLVGEPPPDEQGLQDWAHRMIAVAPGIEVAQSSMSAWLGREIAPWEDWEPSPPSLQDLFGFIEEAAAAHGLRVVFEPLKVRK